jgi:hypothetical protein
MAQKSLEISNTSRQTLDPSVNTVRSSVEATHTLSASVSLPITSAMTSFQDLTSNHLSPYLSPSTYQVPSSTPITPLMQPTQTPPATTQFPRQISPANPLPNTPSASMAAMIAQLTLPDQRRRLVNLLNRNTNLTWQEMYNLLNTRFHVSGMRRSYINWSTKIKTDLQGLTVEERRQTEWEMEQLWGQFEDVMCEIDPSGAWRVTKIGGRGGRRAGSGRDRNKGDGAKESMKKIVGKAHKQKNRKRNDEDDESDSEQGWEKARRKKMRKKQKKRMKTEVWSEEDFEQEVADGRLWAEKRLPENRTWATKALPGFQHARIVRKGPWRGEEHEEVEEESSEVYRTAGEVSTEDEAGLPWMKEYPYVAYKTYIHCSEGEVNEAQEE